MSDARILIVDDEPANRELLEAYLAGRYEVLSAADGESALRLASTAAPDLVVLDVMMPHLDGYAVCAELKRRSADRYLPVLLLTALDGKDQRILGLKAGADDFLVKPVDRTELRLRIEAFLRIRQQEAVIREQVGRLARLQALKDDLLALVVHDVRNPLAALVAWLDVLRASARGDAARDVDAAIDAAGRVGRLIEEVLQIRMLEDAQLPLQLEEVRLRPLAERVGARNAADASAKGLRIVIDVPEQLTARLDQGLVERCFENLVGNALRYAPPDSAVELRAHAGSGEVRLEVLDRGPGVPDALKAHVFEKFGTGKEARGRKGFGLGLYLVHRVAEAHGGRAEVRDREGGGAIFVLALPAAR